MNSRCVEEVMNIYAIEKIVQNRINVLRWFDFNYKLNFVLLLK